MQDTLEVEIQEIVDAARQYQQCLDAEALDGSSNDLRESRRMMLETLTKWKLIAAGPTEQWEQTTINYCAESCLKWLLTFDIPRLVPLDTTATYAELAKAAKVPEQELRRIMRFGMTQGLFSEVTPGQIAHTPYSASFASNEDYRQVVLLQTGFFAPMMKCLAEATAAHDTPSSMNAAAFNIAMHTDDSFYAHIAKTPELTKRFGSGMRFLAGADDTSPKFLVERFDWAGLGNAHVLDVGGSTGHISAALAKVYPQLTFTVQDLPPMIAKANVSQLSPDIAGRIEFVAHDFFRPQPEKSQKADVFLLRMILNNWTSLKCEQILANVAAAMKPGAVLLLNNFMLHKPGTVGKRAEALERARDLFQMAAMNGMERDLEGWNELVGKIAGLKIRDVIRQTGTSQALIVVDKEAS